MVGRGAAKNVTNRNKDPPGHISGSVLPLRPLSQVITNGGLMHLNSLQTDHHHLLNEKVLGDQGKIGCNVPKIHSRSGAPMINHSRVPCTTTRRTVIKTNENPNTGFMRTNPSCVVPRTNSGAGGLKINPTSDLLKTTQNSALSKTNPNIVTAKTNQGSKASKRNPRTIPLEQEELMNLNPDQVEDDGRSCIHSDHESEGFVSPDENIVTQLGKRKRQSKLAGRLNMVLEGNDVTDPLDSQTIDVGNNTVTQKQIEAENENDLLGSGTQTTHSIANANGLENGEATSKVKKKGDRGKYKSYVVDMKIKGKKSKLNIFIPDDIDRAIGDNARHFVNECGRVVRTRAPLNVKNWKEAFAKAGDAMWKEIEGKFEIKEGTSYLKMQAFAIESLQRLYRLWKTRLHYYYKSKECGATDEKRVKNPPPNLPQDQWEYCVKRYASPEFKAISQRNSKNRRSDKRCKHTTGNLSFAEVEDILEKENKGVKPSADMIWLAEHTHKNELGVLEWADESRSKEIHGKLKDVVALHGDSMTQEDILLEVLEPRSGYFRGKGTAVRGYSKARQTLEQQNLIKEQQQKIHDQDKKIKELEENQQQTTRQLEQQNADFQTALAAMKEDLLREFMRKDNCSNQ